MGNQSLQSNQLTAALYNPDLRDWKMVGEGDTYFIWRNSAGSEEMEEYIFTATDAKEFEFMRQVFQFRHEKQHLVSSKYFREVKKAEICSTFYQGHVYTERIPLRLNEIKDIPHPDSLHLINACLLGFKQLYEKVGSFTITDHLIGINSEAKIKVWVNSDFGKPNHDGNLAVRRDDERKMVVEIIEVVDKIIDHRTEPESVTAFISQGGTPTFDEAIERLTEYTIRHRTTIPPILNSIAQLRDLGYFKKMHPKGNSLHQSINLNQGRFSGLPQGFRGFQPSYNPIPSPISPVSGFVDQISPTNQEIPFPGTEGFHGVQGSAPLPPFNPAALSGMIPPITSAPSYPIHPNNAILTAPITRAPLPVNGSLRAGINYPVKTISLAKTPSITPITPSINPIPHVINTQNYSRPPLPLSTQQTTRQTTTIPTPFTPRFDDKDPLTSIYDSIIKNQTYHSHPLPTIPTKIELTVTKLTSNSSDNRIITNFVLNTKDYPSASNLESILYHTTQLEKTLEEGSRSHPNAIQRSTREEYSGSSYRNDFDSGFRNDSGWNQEGGHTDPNLLKGALSIIGKIIDSNGQNSYDSNRTTDEGFTNPQLLGMTKLISTTNYSSNQGFTNPSLLEGFKPSTTSSYENDGWGNDTNYKLNEGTSQSLLLNIKNLLPQMASTANFGGSNEQSSPQIMALIRGDQKRVSFT